MDKTPKKKLLLRPQEAAKTLSTSTRTLARWRAEDVGPPWFTVGRAVYYPEKEIAAWIQDQLLKA